MQILKNITTGWMAFITQILVVLFITPFVIDTLGKELYGIWALVVSVLTFLYILDLGITSAMRRYYSRAIGQNDLEGQLKVFNTSLVMFLLITALCLTITLVFSKWGSSIFDLQSKYSQLFRVLLMIFGLALSVTFFCKPWGGILGAHERYEIVYGLQIIWDILRGLTTYVVLKAGFGLSGLAWTYFACTVGRDLSEVLAAYLLYSSKINISLRHSEWTLLKTLVGYSGTTAFIIVCDYLRGHLNTLMVAWFTKTDDIAHYAIAMQFIGYFIHIIRVANITYMPRLSRLEGEGNWDGLKLGLMRGIRLNSAITFFVAVSLWFYAGPFIYLWLDPSFSVSYGLLQIMVPATAVGLGLSLITSLLYATSKHGIYAKISAAEVIVDLGSSALLLSLIGVYGAAWGTLIAILGVRTGLLLFAGCRVSRLSLREFLLQGFSRSLSFGLVYGVATGSIAMMTDEFVGTWTGFILSAFLAALIGTLLFILIVVKSSERKEIFSRIRDQIIQYRYASLPNSSQT
jgi:O-antigen/teichoic acid export membrane protein